MNGDDRPRLRLVGGRGSGARSVHLHPLGDARAWHPSEGGRPPLALVPPEAAPGERARLLWWRRVGAVAGLTTLGPTTALPVDDTHGVLIEMAAWR